MHKRKSLAFDHNLLNPNPNGDLKQQHTNDSKKITLIAKVLGN
jgi:hypothetical protein